MALRGGARRYARASHDVWRRLVYNVVVLVCGAINEPAATSLVGMERSPLPHARFLSVTVWRYTADLAHA
jgi:hypothetical protein